MGELGEGYIASYDRYFAPQQEGGKFMSAAFTGALLELKNAGIKVSISWDKKDEWGLQAAKNYVKYWVKDRWDNTIQQGISDVMAGAMENGWSLAQTINHLEDKFPKLVQTPDYTEIKQLLTQAKEHILNWEWLLKGFRSRRKSFPKTHWWWYPEEL